MGDKEKSTAIHIGVLSIYIKIKYNMFMANICCYIIYVGYTY